MPPRLALRLRCDPREPAQYDAALRLRQRGIQLRRAAEVVVVEPFDLVTLKREQRGHHDRRARPLDARQLVDRRFAAPGG